MVSGWDVNLLRAVWLNAGVGLMVQDSDRQIIAVNPSFEQITGWHWRDIGGKRCDLVFGCHTSSGKCIHDEDCPGLRVINGEVPRVTREFLINLDDGRECWVEATVFPIKDDEGRVEYIVTTFQDTSEKKRYSAELLHTKTLASLGQLASELAHEVKNPLNAIQIQMQLLEQEISSHKEASRGEIPEMVSKVKEEVTRLTGLVDNCLKFSRSGNLVLKREALGPLLEDLVQLVMPQADLIGVKIRLDAEKNLPAVMVDKEKLRQALLNIVINAFEAMPDGGTLTIRAARDGDAVKMICKDTGRGVPEDVKDNIFELFFTTKKGGTGIGLPLSHNIIQSHGGTLSCNSDDRGTEFVIELPLENTPG
ncbi:MAG: ATP-binding protein [Candidatus Brocadiales bacterium]